MSDNSNQETVWVNFEVQPADEHSEVMLKGAWDDWQAASMRRKKDGSFYTRKKIPVGTWEYGFEGDDSCWLVNAEAETTPSPFGSLNNLISVDVA